MDEFPPCISTLLLPLDVAYKRARQNNSRTTLRQQLRRRMDHNLNCFVPIRDVFILRSTLHSCKAIITGLPALVLLCPNVLAEMNARSKFTAENKISDEVLRLLTEASTESLPYPQLLSQINDDDVALSKYWSLTVENPPLAPGMISSPYMTLPIVIPCLSQSTIAYHFERLLKCLSRLHYNEAPGHPSSYANIIQDGHYLTLPFVVTTVYKHEEHDLYILILLSRSPCACAPLFHSLSTADTNWYDFDYLYSAYPRYTFRLRALIHDNVPIPRRQQLQDQGFDVQTSCTVWGEHDCSDAGLCPQRLRNVGDGFDFYVETSMPLRRPFTQRRMLENLSSRSKSLPFWIFGGPQCETGGLSFKPTVHVSDELAANYDDPLPNATANADMDILADDEELPLLLPI